MFSISSVTGPQAERFQPEVQRGAKRAACSVCFNISDLFAENIGFELKIHPHLCRRGEVSAVIRQHLSR